LPSPLCFRRLQNENDMLHPLLDIRTLALTNVLFGLLFGVGFILYAREHKEFGGLRLFGVANFCVAASTLLIGLRGQIPDAFSILGGNLLIVVALIAYYEAVIRFRNRPTPPGWFWGVVLTVHAGVVGWFSMATPSLTGRVVWASLLLMIFAFAVVRALMRHQEKGLERGYLFTAIPFMLMGLVALFRLVLTLTTPQPDDLMAMGTPHALTFLSTELAMIGSAFGFVWVASTRLRIELETQARIDPLTQVFNRLVLDEVLTRDLAFARRSGEPLAVLMADIDHFKELNDRFGHQAGDRALRGVAQTIKQHLRPYDVVIRYGGEEFLIVLPNTQGEQAVEVAEKLKEAVAQQVQTADATPIRISMGVTTYDPAKDSWDTLIGRADAAMYGAKHKGRDCVVWLSA